MSKIEPASQEELHAFADGQLPPERSAEIERFLQINPQAAAQVRDYRLLNQALREAFAADPLPDDGIAEMSAAAPVRRPERRVIRLALAASLACLLLGGGAGWIARGAAMGSSGDTVALQSLAERTLAAYQVFAPDPARPVEIAATDAPRLKTWLSNRMHMDVVLPDLRTAGFTLIGGRLMASDGIPAGMLMYENSKGQRLVLYIRNDLPSAAPSKMTYRHTNAGGLLYWRDAAVAIGVAGGFSEPELRPVGDLVRASFTS